MNITQEIVIPGESDNKDKEEIVRFVANEWPEGWFGDAMSARSMSIRAPELLTKLSDDFYLFRTIASHEYWDSGGVSSENTGDTMRVMFDYDRIRCEAGPPETPSEKVANQIQTMLKAARRMRTQAPPLPTQS